MSARNVSDAFERLVGLDLKGKQDREIIRVLIECCAQEKMYNSFYAELIELLCTQNRQFKTTVQFSFWDAFKKFDESFDSNTRRSSNLAKMLAHLVCTFHIPMVVLKPLEISDLKEEARLFLSTLLQCILSESVKEAVFQQVFDRIAGSKDFAAVRELLLFFLKHHFTLSSLHVDDAEADLILKRRKWCMKTLESMSVIDMVRS